MFFLCVVCLLSQLFLGFCLSMGFGADSFLKMLALHGFWWGFHIPFLFVVFSWLCSFNPPFGFWGSWGNEMKKISTLMPILCSEGAILGLCLVHQCVLRFAIMEFQCSSWTEWRTRTRFFLMGSLRENRERKECEIWILCFELKWILCCYLYVWILQFKAFMVHHLWGETMKVLQCMGFWTYDWANWV